ncbi:carboxypeptidase-like regulatory domain-containing protein [Campylobacter sp. JMF_01 NE2]|uniref:hypothetical protein n=1 Tax=unclassified Campylobacter TaxID=2593542 RepID=UPI001B43978B|nr:MULTISPECIES: hypothetical protein [unclassified Campylobacter]MBP3224121.1 hypothetical protein [Campylobacter sp.]MDA3052027.1 carboxypeptidase-like regulatory domain-containing protein [Campylobacter sp. JMF_03 NE3]MDA3066361.1 carboxypeptidase-like regulatory domain-containing protein [Campylobacter sp. JMF_01 NE2]
MRVLISVLFCAILAFAHGISYNITHDKAVIINANFATSIPAKHAKVRIYQGDSALAMQIAQTDENGKLAFLPPAPGKYRVEISAQSDHGEHRSEFSVDIDENFGVSKYDELAFAKYQGLLSVIGIIFGLFGIIALIKSKKRAI